MRGLTVIVIGEDEARFRAALTLACSHAALGGRVRVYCHERAVTMLLPDASATAANSGVPSRGELLGLAAQSGIEMIACQTGLALAGISAEQLSPGTEGGGMVGLLATLGDDRLATI